MSAFVWCMLHPEGAHDFIEAAAKGVMSIWRAVFMLADISLTFPLHEPWVNILVNRHSTSLPGGGLRLSNDEIMTPPFYVLWRQAEIFTDTKPSIDKDKHVLHGWHGIHGTPQFIALPDGERLFLILADMRL